MLNFQVFFKKLKKTIDLKQKKIYIAVSGGVDSLVLLDLFFRLKNKLTQKLKPKRQRNIQIEILHCNFKLRGEESDKSEKLIQKIAKKYQMILHTKKFNINQKSSQQIWARKLRYFWFKAMLKTNSFNYIALGHHLNDSIETVLINLIRGTGIKGIKGIRFKKKYLIRPLLDFTKQDILNYAKNKKINWIEDSSNVKDKYLRNKIRKILKKLLTKDNYYSLGLIKSFKILKEEDFILKTHFNLIKQYVLLPNKTLRLIKLFNLYPIKSYFYSLLPKYKVNNINKIMQILICKSGKTINIPKAYIRRQPKNLTLTFR